MEPVQKDINTKALKSGIWYMLSNLVVKAMALITTPVFTRLLTKEQFGDYSNFLVWSHIAVILVTMKMEASLISAKFDYDGRLNQYNLSILALTLCSTFIWVLILFLFPDYFVGLTGVNIAYLYYILIYCFFYAVVSYFQIQERFQYRYKRSVYIGMLVAVTSAILSIIMVLTMQDRLKARVLGGIIPTIIIGAVLVSYFIRKGKNIVLSVWPYALKISIPYVPHLLSLLLLSSIDRVMITKICGPADNALYSVAYSCGHMVVLVMTTMNSAFVPWIGDKLHDMKYDEIRRVSKYYILFFCLSIIPLILLAPEVLLIMGGKDYLEAKYVMIPIALGCVCQFLYTLFVNVEQYMKKTTGMAIASIATAVLNYILNSYLIPRYGYMSAAYTTFVSYVFLLGIHMYLVRLIGMQKAFSYKYVITIMVAMSIIGFVVNVSYDSLICRYVISLAFFLLLSIVLWAKRNEARGLLVALKKKES